MATIEEYRQIIQGELKEYTEIPYAYGDLRCRLIVSEDRNNFLLITQGWEGEVQMHGCLVHVEVIGDKVWIHRDGLEDGIANDLVRAGIPKGHIVLGFHPPEVRSHTEFAVS
ncbi:XisI protein [Coleofasciculus chthonoplastes PCC 7420]|uniref:XisI protein n=1 Tax=Coleofasciculus chthonoplastes PCC 7420 TaxID=118168 RepID=B4VWN1_9CYAN|nr:XisI protein [Coleofasciculus chthonoplastes]EDX73634.1 XisI protein [Coleofasciculus chthonoplastes PCC 7420]